MLSGGNAGTLFTSKTSVAALSVGANTLLVILKIAIGLSMGSMSVLSEGIHSAVDLLAAAIALLAVRIASRPADEQHPYGHGKWENVSGTVEALLILGAAGLIIYEAVEKILQPVPLESLDLGIALMAFSALVNFGAARLIVAVIRHQQSVALEADALHHDADVYTSIGVLGGLLVVRLTGVYILDPIIAIAVALLIIKAAIDLTRKSFADLLDARLPAQEEERIAAVLAEHADAFQEFHDLRSRRSGNDRHIDFHLVVDPHKTVAEAHALADHLEEEIKRYFPTSSVTTHLEPGEADSEQSEPAAAGNESNTEE